MGTKKITGLREVAATPAISGGTLTIDCSAGNFFAVNMTANITALNFTNVPAAGEGVRTGAGIHRHRHRAHDRVAGEREVAGRHGAHADGDERQDGHHRALHARRRRVVAPGRDERMSALDMLLAAAGGPPRGDFIVEGVLGAYINDDWTPPPGVTEVWLLLIGGGGYGYVASSGSAGGGGGGGLLAVKVALNPGERLRYWIQPGAGPSARGLSVQVSIVDSGGSVIAGGFFANAGNTPTGSGTGGTGGTGGANGDVRYTGAVIGARRYWRCWR
ncbi:hypothetical protein ACU4GD_28230 [Cupriavidus basilensis]